MKTFDETKDPVNSVATDRLSNDLDPRDETIMFDNGPASPKERYSNEAVKGAGWLLAIVGIFALAVLFAWLVGSHNGPFSSRSESRQAEILSQQDPGVTQTLTPASASQFVAVLVQPVKPASATAAAASSSVKAADSESYADRIEREAREVINGEFGDNPMRKAKLGADYAAVQARVNQILM